MTKEEILKKIEASDHKERCKLAMKESVNVLDEKGYKFSFYDFGDVVHLADAWEPDSDREVHNKLRSLGTKWRESSESYSYYPPEEW